MTMVLRFTDISCRFVRGPRRLVNVWIVRNIVNNFGGIHGERTGGAERLRHGAGAETGGTDAATGLKPR
ncbi:hypothetical protein [Streptomyces botrytidirepellens]|uniref:hypothetical protein n=1 Tax=Streptomyces botrytidirepellens TaxID=2486417 RepID=UPI0011CD48A7|nr:hypothetical protein [Streptomyces botrytidirepellens]